MTVKELAVKLDIPLKEAKELTGLNHHNNTIKKSVLDEVLGETETVDVAKELTETKVVQPKSKLSLPDGVTAEKVWHSIAVGKKSPLWEYRELAKAPSEYKGK